MNQSIGILMIWLAINGLIGAVIGEKKKRLGAGFLFGLLLGPIGWLLVGMGPNHGPKCPECGGDVVEGAKRCKNCGVELYSIERSVEDQIDNMEFPDSPFGSK